MSLELHPYTAPSSLGLVLVTPSYTGLTALYRKQGLQQARAKAWTAVGSLSSGFSKFLPFDGQIWIRKKYFYTQRSLQRHLVFVSANVAEVGVFSNSSAASEMLCWDESLLLLQPSSQILPS